MIKDFINIAKAGDPVYISTVYDAFNSLEDNEKQVVYCQLTLLENDEKRLFIISLPLTDGCTDEEINFVKSYLWAEIYNILSCLGGKNMHIYVNESDKLLRKIVAELNNVFCIDSERSQRIGYGRAVNVIDRMREALCPGEPGFRFIINDIFEMPELSSEKKEQKNNMSIFTKATSKLEGKIICGMDIGGTDIKTVLIKDGRINCYKEYDWFPATFKVSRQLIDPICLIVRLLRAKVSLEMAEDNSSEMKLILMDNIHRALDKDKSTVYMLDVINKTENFLNGKLAEIDAIGLCFPDVVVRDKIVGGEVYKTRGIRDNPNIDYEKDFKQLTNLNDRLKELLQKDGAVKIINDGPMAAFTAAVESAAAGNSIADGIFAHTLGTELGTGWVDENGEIPDIPLEVYNCIIDLGSFGEKQYQSDDLRSVKNFNTGLSGTLQKYCSQSGVFRLAMKYLPGQRPSLFQELIDKKFVTIKEIDGQLGYYVLMEPNDMRKPFLEHMMALPKREQDEVCDRIWREIGEFIAVTWLETEKILKPMIKTRILFGRLVKDKRCVELIKEGAKKIKKDIQLLVADSEMANTFLMRQLEKKSAVYCCSICPSGWCSLLCKYLIVLIMAIRVKL